MSLASEVGTKRGGDRDNHWASPKLLVGQAQNICRPCCWIFPHILLLLFQNVWGQKALPISQEKSVRVSLSLPPPLLSTFQVSLPQLEKQGGWEGLPHAQSWQKHNTLGSGGTWRSSRLGSGEARLLIKPCWACGFNLNIQEYKSWNLSLSLSLPCISVN